MCFQRMLTAVGSAHRAGSVSRAGGPPPSQWSLLMSTRGRCQEGARARGPGTKVPNLGLSTVPSLDQTAGVEVPLREATGAAPSGGWVGVGWVVDKAWSAGGSEPHRVGSPNTSPGAAAPA